ncbi:tudor domain-containing 6-like [Alosa pseudoharengus]|uniref:tudor domain-containing 6-like n=1 Tax=Alosa pseudoharengus TaxID=34774 RepID=UPI003F8CBEE8
MEWWVGGRDAGEQWFNGYGNRNNGTGSYFRTKYDGSKLRDHALPRIHKDYANPVLSDTLKVDSFYTVTVQFVKNPSEFWVQTELAMDRHDAMQMEMSEMHYCGRGNDLTIQSPKEGILCAALIKPDGIYRALVKAVHGTKVQVYFVDHGNEAIVDQKNLRILCSGHRTLQALAFKCSLSDICPIDQDWSQKAIDFFVDETRQIMLDMHVIAQCQDKYMVELFFKTDDLKSINEMMWVEGFAVKDVADDRYSPRPDSGCSTAEGSGDSTEGDSMRSNEQCGTCDFVIGHTKTVLKEHLFTIGRSAQVVVSHIEGPGKFWCQLSQCVPSLERLMEELQNHYVQSKPVQPSGPDCVVLHPQSSLWHRGQIVKLHSFPHVDVQLVDYGNTVRVTHQELRPLDSAFAKLRRQAFQCRLVDATCPSKLPPPEWAASVTEFCNFVHSAPASTLKCTIYGIMYDSEGTVNNLVDLTSSSVTFVQSQSASASISQKAPKECSAPEMEVGLQETVWITCVKDVHTFYGQLVRHSGEIEKLNERIEFFCRQPHGIKCSLSPGTPCFAKYSDGRWYRGQVKMTHPVLLVHFLDYGDIIAVKQTDILPVLDEARDIMSFPVQAMEFNLSDVPVDTNGEVNRWFDNNATGQRFTVKVLKKYPDGKYTVELYDGKLNVNKAIKDKVQNTRPDSLKVLDHPPLPHHDPSTVGKHMSDLSAPFIGDDGIKQQGSPSFLHGDRKATPANSNVSKSGSISTIPPMSQKLEMRPSKTNMEDFSKTKPLGLPVKKTNDDMAMGATTTLCTTIHDLAQIEKPVSVKGIHVHSGPCSASFPKLDDLPDQLITPDVETEVYVSHVNSPDSFFVQLVENEDRIHSLVEQLNVDQPCNDSVDLRTLQEGDVVGAIFPEDESWYRAVIKKMNNNGSVLVEFIDFGNEATIASNQTRCLEKNFLEVPKLCIHCCLYAGSTLLSAEELMIKLRETTADGEAKKMNCVFIKEFGLAWEIRLSSVAESSEDTKILQ